MLTIFKPGCHVKQRKSESRVELGHGRAIYGDRLSLFFCIYYVYVCMYIYIHDRWKNSISRLNKSSSFLRFSIRLFHFFFLFPFALFQVSQKSGIWEGGNFSAAGGAEGPSRSVSHAASLDAISRRAVKPETARVPCRSLTCSVCK